MREEFQPNKGLSGAFGASARKAPQGSTGSFDTAGDKRFSGRGLVGLPDTFTGWDAPARYAFAPALNFTQQSAPAIDVLRGEMNRDYEGDLFNAASEQITTGAEGQKAQRRDANVRAGYGGGETVSPLMQRQMELEDQARTGALGQAAQMAVIRAGQLRSEAALRFNDALSQQMQALLTPAQFQSARRSQVPLVNVGPSPVAAGLGAAGAIAGAY